MEVKRAFSIDKETFFNFVDLSNLKNRHAKRAERKIMTFEKSTRKQKARSSRSEGGLTEKSFYENYV
jgi:hypothetical protein